MMEENNAIVEPTIEDEINDSFESESTSTSSYDTSSTFSSSETSSSSTSSSSSVSIDEEFDEIAQRKNSDFLTAIKRYTNANFKRHFRISRTTANIIIDKYKAEVTPGWLPIGDRDNDDLEKEVYIFLWYTSNSLTCKQLGQLFNITGKMALIIINRISSWIVSISYKFIKWPRTAERIQQVTSGFERLSGIGGVLGTLEGNHIRVKLLSKQIPLYTNKQNYCSTIIQAVVDSDNKFLDIYCGEPGSVHYNKVLLRSILFRKATDECFTIFPNNTFLLGDNEYEPQPWLVTPFIDAGNLTEQQRKYNYLHLATRAVAQTTFGMLKTRFRRLLNFTEFSNISTVVNISVACCVLHNICIDERDYWSCHEIDEDRMSQMLNAVDIGRDNGLDRRAVLIDALINKRIL